MVDIVALGELLIDFTPIGVSENGNELFEKNPGGAPANVLAAVRKLGKTSAIIGMVGNDQFGNYLESVLKQLGIDTSGLVISKEVNTTLAFVHLDKSGDRSFSFYRNPGADMMLKDKDVKYDLIKNANIFHFGSISLTHEPARSATFVAVKYAKENGCLISYDPNLRPPLWESLKQAKNMIISGLEYADILKISEVELEFITGTADVKKGSLMLHNTGVDTVLVTLGANGCYYSYKGGAGTLSTYDARVVDTTGAGDAFLGAVLYRLSGMKKDDINNMKNEDFADIIDFANSVGALATTKKGGIPSMPFMREVCECRDNIAKLY